MINQYMGVAPFTFQVVYWIEILGFLLPTSEGSFMQLNFQNQACIVPFLAVLLQKHVVKRHPKRRWNNEEGSSKVHHQFAGLTAPGWPRRYPSFLKPANYICCIEINVATLYPKKCFFNRSFASNASQDGGSISYSASSAIGPLPDARSADRLNLLCGPKEMSEQCVFWERC